MKKKIRVDKELFDEIFAENEKLKERIFTKDMYNTIYWEAIESYYEKFRHLEEQLAIKDEALNLACEKIIDALDSEQVCCSKERGHLAEMQKECLVKQAKENIYVKNNNT